MTNKEVYQEVYKKMEEYINLPVFVCNEIENITGCRCSNFEELQLFKEENNGHAWLSDPFSSNPIHPKYYANNRKVVNNFKLTVLALCIAMCEN